MEIRIVRENELNEAAALANKIFRSGMQGDMGAFFPTLFRTGVSHSYGAFDPAGNLVSFMGLVPVQIKSGTGRILAFSVGAVCTDPQSRGLGLASELLNQCREHAERSGASLLFISGERSLYTRAGSLAFGRASKFVIKSNSDKPLEVAGETGSGSATATVRDMIPEDIFNVHNLLQQRPATIEWSLQELQQFIGSAPYAGVSGLRQHIRVVESLTGQIIAMGVFAVPMDPEVPEVEIPVTAAPPTADADVLRNGHLLEWAGNPEAMPLLISDAVSRFRLDELTAILPWHDAVLSEVLQQAFQVRPDNQNNAGTVMIVDAAALITQAGFSEDGQPDKPVISVLTDSQFELRIGDHTIPINGNSELCSVLFDPESPVLKPTGLSENPTTVQLPYMYGLYFI